jgi:hypothetical protein
MIPAEKPIPRAIIREFSWISAANSTPIKVVTADRKVLLPGVEQSLGGLEAVAFAVPCRRIAPAGTLDRAECHLYHELLNRLACRIDDDLAIDPTGPVDLENVLRLTKLELLQSP